MAQAAYVRRLSDGVFEVANEEECRLWPLIARPEATALDQPARLLIWRQDVTPMFRELSAEEAMMCDEAANGIPFGVLCEMLATYDDPDGAAARGAGYLHGWITSGILTAVSAE